MKVNGAWISVPASKILKQTAPDLGFHLWLYSASMGSPIPYCVVVPPEI